MAKKGVGDEFKKELWVLIEVYAEQCRLSVEYTNYAQLTKSKNALRKYVNQTKDKLNILTNGHL